MASSVTHTYNTRSAVKMANVSDKVNKKQMHLRKKYKKSESSDSDTTSEEDADADDEEWIDASEADASASEADTDTGASEAEADTDKNSADEDDLLSEDEDDFIVKDNKQLNEQSFQSLLSELFPSKYINDKVAKIKPSIKDKKNKKYEREQAVSPSESSTPSSPKRPSAPAKKPPRMLKKKNYKVEEEERTKSPNKMSNFNIIFTINPANLGKNKAIEDYEDYHSSDDPEYDPEETEEEYTTHEADASEADASEADALDENSEIDTDDYSDGDEDTDGDEDYNMDICDMDLIGTNEVLTEAIGTCTGTKCTGKCTDTDAVLDNKKSCKKKLLFPNKRLSSKQDARICKKRKFKNTLKFRTLLQQKNVMNDLNYFQEKMSLEEQETVLKQMAEIKALIDIEKPYRLALLEAAIPPRFKACAYNKLSTLKNMEPGCSEYNKIKHWVDDFMRIPFNKLNHLPVCIDDGIEKCHDFMAQAKDTLDKAVYGLDDVKLQVMQMVGQWITNPDAIGNSIAIEGPPGTGKTTLVKEGISKILNREFVFIPLGGATDSSCLEGHSYTYEGSNCGLIVKQLIQCQSMNPIIYFDELDKISDTPKGDEIVGILTHLTDTSQNSSFHDKYFAEFDFDLSRCVFFFSYNDRSKVNKILLDRMHCIMTKGYSLPQKTIISKDYLLPVIRNLVRFKEGEIILPEETLQHIINTHTHKEDGVRNLKRCLEIIHTKLNLYRLMRPDTNLFEKDMAIKVVFPITITPQIVDKLIKNQSEAGGAWQNMYL
jgi:hypothetical protein